ncbi:hypothetical protein ACTXG7_03140 [Mycolicibacterium sp. Dal123E01]|uniref:hypothetical protein n=1 Tax=Mycolicibacterium sp. Dal123E01 TaxID=3457578 RepID=UPI00403E555C
MPAFEVVDEGLNVLAAQCSIEAARLADQVPTAQAGRPLQATAGAVGSVYSAVRTAAAAMAARVRATGDRLTTAAAQYVSTEDTSAQDLAALGNGLVPG